ncbi:unnamed protein product [Somion occarium]|uniref:U3 small nucleolar RNA-associated protein 4 n=1 Tax=Somion occarium TaxID=3059160 RepID=A0ABP1CQW7_9APHY
MVEGTTLSVHRCRFVDYQPSAVTALAFPPLPLPSVKGKKKAASRKRLRFGTLAIGRANGNIELCEWTGHEHQSSAPQAWVVKKTLSGPYMSKVDSLAFTIKYPDQIAADEVPSWSNLRLFSAGGGSELAEWDIERGTIRRTISSQGGSIWSASANPASTLLALGCEDGSVRILSLEYDTLTHLRRLDRVKSRILSLAWGPPVPRDTSKPSSTSHGNDEESSDEEEDDWTDSWLVAGCSDSSLRKWDIASGRVLDRMGTDKQRGERTLVWTVGVLGDGMIVSGDSLGTVKFWDSRTCTQIQSFQAHNADVLCLTISPEGTAIYTSGVDQKVVQFTLVKTSQSSNAQSSLLSRATSRWVQSTSRRLHSHDVRALAIWPPYTPLPPSHKRQFPLDVAPLLASGGLDMNVVIAPAALPASTMTKVVNPLGTSTISTFEDAYHRRLAYSSGSFNGSALHLAKGARLLLCMRDSGISIWKISRKQKPSLGVEDMITTEDPTPQSGAPDRGWDRVLDMALNVTSNLVASAISDDGKWVTVSDWYETKLFCLEQLANGDLKPKRIRDFTAIIQSSFPNAKSNQLPSTGASSFIFTPDSTKLVMATAMSGYILVIDLNTGEPKPRVLRRFEQHRMQNIVIGNRVVKGRKGPDQDVEMQDADVEEKVAEGVSDNESEVSDDGENGNKQASVTVTRMAVSPDGQWLATSDDRSRTHVFNLDSIQHHCVLPTFPQPIHALSFEPSSPSTLILALANNTLQIYDVESRQFPTWSRHLLSALPPRFTQLHDPVLGVTFDPEPPATGGTKKMALFWGATWLCKVQLDAAVWGYGGFDKKRRRDGKKYYLPPPPPQIHGSEDSRGGGQQERQTRNFKLITHYRPILFVDFIAAGELVIVERPLVDVLSKLPPAFFKPKYGAS